MAKKRILWVSDSPDAPTGNGKITRNFVSQMKEHYDIACLGRGYIGWPGESEKNGCMIYPMNIGKPYPDLMKEIGRQFRPQAVISCLDMWQIDWIEHAMHSRAISNIGYISIYCKPVPCRWKRVVKNLDYAVCCSEFGRSVLKEFMPYSSLDMIHLGVDWEVYHPLSEKDVLKKKHNLNGQFVVGCIARNQIRKRFDKLIEGFAIFARNHKDVHLYLKTEANTEHGYLIPDIVKYYGISNKITVDEHREYCGSSENSAVEMYNLFDVYVQTAGVEGFGFPFLEAMACGVPVIAPDYSAMSELIAGRGILLRPVYGRVVGGTCIEHGAIHTDELASKLEELYTDSEKREKIRAKGMEYAKEFSWERFHTRWREVLANVAWDLN